MAFTPRTTSACRAGLLSALASLWTLTGCGPQATQPQAGTGAPAFPVERVDGTQARFPDDYRGRVVALRFWADWCPFCKDEMQAIETVYRRQRDAGLAVLALNVGQSREAAERFARGLGISYEVALDPDAEVSARYGVVGLPLTYFIDRQGTVRNKILGEASPDAFEGVATALLQEPAP
jgi:cytochrome c biogenesis protein CcmG, thiol:disulfide interchange protein DsbE